MLGNPEYQQSPTPDVFKPEATPKVEGTSPPINNNRYSSESISPTNNGNPEPYINNEGLGGPTSSEEVKVNETLSPSEKPHVLGMKK